MTIETLAKADEKVIKKYHGSVMFMLMCGDPDRGQVETSRVEGRIGKDVYEMDTEMGIIRVTIETIPYAKEVA